MQFSLGCMAAGVTPLAKLNSSVTTTSAALNNDHVLVPERFVLRCVRLHMKFLIASRQFVCFVKRAVFICMNFQKRS